jgi:4-diphosphocytidyl-2-C-methyl-D-erythritol kinase
MRDPETSSHLLAPAKINLHLRVGAARADGFHPLLTWMVTVGLADVLTVSPNAGGLVFSCDDPTLPTDGRNLVVKAIATLAARLGREPSVSIHLAKRVPAGGGLGGGSSDAAHTLMAIAKLWGVNDPSLLAEVAGTVGSDVPFFLYGPSSICRGRGELVMPVAAPAVARHAVLVLPGIEMPTAAVYRTFDEMGLGSDTAGDAGEGGLTFLPAAELMRHLLNDLEPPAFALRPDLAEMRSNLERDLGRPVRMSGSGSTLFTLFDDHGSAADAAAAVTAGGTRAVAVAVAPAA